MESKSAPIPIPGAKLASNFFDDANEPVLKRLLPQLKYGAGLLGAGSEVLGFDTAISRDHDWGPRFQIFLSEPDFVTNAESIAQELKSQLPATYSGYPVRFLNAAIAPFDASCGTLGSRSIGGEILTRRSFLLRELGFDQNRTLSAADWLSFPQQNLRSITSGRVFRDESGLIRAMRAMISFYPDDIWLYLIYCQWSKIAQEQAFVGRTGDVGDELGSSLIAARLVQSLMRLCFLMERQYAPYSKWFGKAFSELECASRLHPMFVEVLGAREWKDRERSLCNCFREVGRLQLRKKIPGSIEPEIRNYHERPYFVMNVDEIASSIFSQIGDPSIRLMPKIGSVDQLSDSPDFLCNLELTSRLQFLLQK